MTQIWLAMYLGLFVFNGFCAWAGVLGYRPFRRRWQLVAWHIFLMIEVAASALFLNTDYQFESYRTLLRLAWMGALIIGITILVGWLRQSLRELRENGQWPRWQL